MIKRTFRLSNALDQQLQKASFSPSTFIRQAIEEKLNRAQLFTVISQEMHEMTKEIHQSLTAQLADAVDPLAQKLQAELDSLAGAHDDIMLPLVQELIPPLKVLANRMNRKPS